MSESGPGLPSPQALSAVLILVTVLHALALVLTSFRLWFRHHIRRLWWDDFWAALALLCDPVCLAATWLYSAPLDEPNSSFGGLSSIPTQSRSIHIISFWLEVLVFTCVIWFSRLSIVFSVVRILPPSRKTLVMVLGAGGVFVCLWIYVFTCKIVVCSVDRSWYRSASIVCHMPKWVAVSEVCTDAVSDVILVVLPLYLLWHVRLPSTEKIMVFSVFSTSIFVTAVSVVHTVYLIPNINFIEGLTAQLEGALSLIVCNLLVIVMFFYRVMRSGERGATTGASCKNRQSSNCLTTVDLNVSGGSQVMSVPCIGTSTASDWVERSGGTGFTRVSEPSAAAISGSDKNLSPDSLVAGDLSSRRTTRIITTMTVGTDPSPSH